MARRKDSRIVKIRTEENDLDNQLREAGLFEDGMDFDTKKAMLAMLEESRKSAQEEENQRQQWKEQEEEILKETLNRSFRNNIEESHQGKTQSSENQSTTNNEAEQITSSVGTSSKGLSDTGLPIDKKDDSDEEMVPCPLCQNFFPVQKIEVHASDCSDLVDNPETPQPKEVNKKGKRKRLQNKQPAPDINIEQESEETKTSDMTTSGEARSSAGHEKCTFCKKLFKEGDDFLNHVNSCKSMEAIQHNIVSPTTSKSPGFKSVRPKVGADSPIRVVGGSTPVVKTGNLFDRLEGNLECITGDITDSTYRNSHIALAQILNCVAVKPHGLSQILATKYPYCNSYKSRRAIGTRNCAILEDRPRPGNIKICRPDSASSGPLVVNIFGQFYMGKARNQNLLSKRLINQLQYSLSTDPNLFKQKESLQSDQHLLAGIKEDTYPNRVDWFNEGLKQLVEKIPFEKITQVVFPYRIGCGLAGGNWERDYFPAVKRFANQVSIYDIKVKIVQKIEVQNSDNELAVIETVKKTITLQKYYSRN
ncbi:uncharacterized protein LOC121864978 isoform X2 [Homarus americanus]|uniref:uncharacterized protein LOC121864978 isoform X2 n=1 Tax=Homarus americanus TaxID=6706 RepID=UPI001C4467AB|nr:uncharacterized protein LOC121864978 isoform X2 [Homarus americanus]